LNKPPVNSSTNNNNKLEIVKGKGLGKSESQRYLFNTQKN